MSYNGCLVELAAKARGPALEARRIAVITTDHTAVPSIEQFLVPVFHTTLLNSVEDAIELLASTGLDAILLDLESGDAPTSNGLANLQALRKAHPNGVLIALSRSGGHGMRNKAKQAGSDDFFIAPVDFQELQVVLQRAIAERLLEIEERRLSEQGSGKIAFGELVGGSEAMRRVYESITRVADSPTTVLIRGESGTGKELVARALVSLSSRAEKPYVSVNCAALPENLIEAELFGHEKGAFTGAHAARAGHIENAHTGTLFLDEIATLGLGLQSKLLRVLEDHSIQRLGGKTSKKIDFRLITATNEGLEEMVEAGRFREDLYYRINVVPVHLPALRERAGDIPLLVEHFLRIYCAAINVPLKRVDPEVMETLEEFEWPGNVRELENLIQRLVIMADGPVILLKHLPKQLLVSSAAQQQQLLIPEGGIHFEDELVRIERAYLEAALGRTGGSKAAAARLLRIPPQRMKYLCRKHSL